jgi:HEAT repeat protein
MHLGSHAERLKDKVKKLMDDSEKSVQPQAALTLWKISGEVEPSLKALTEMTKSFNLEYEALSAIHQMGLAAAPAVEEIAAHLDNEDSSMRSLAVEILGQLGSVAQPYREELQELAENDEDPLVRYYANKTLEAIAKADVRAQVR